MAAIKAALMVEIWQTCMLFGLLIPASNALLVPRLYLKTSSALHQEYTLSFGHSYLGICKLPCSRYHNHILSMSSDANPSSSSNKASSSNKVSSSNEASSSSEASMQDNTSKDTAPAAKPPPKLYHWTVCWVPAESNVEVIRKVTSWRTLLRDPGLYRWPPHVNILYPFVSAHLSRKQQKAMAENGSILQPIIETIQDITTKVDSDDDLRDENNSNIQASSNRKVWDVAVLSGLQAASEACEPFSVDLSRFRTFGGKNRGVLWLDPHSYRKDTQNRDLSAEQTSTTPSDYDTSGCSPLVKLQALLQEQFLLCSDQQKGGSYTPHMTLSHFTSLDAALEAQNTTLDGQFEALNDITVSEIYVLNRAGGGDDEQFKRVLTLKLGRQQNASTDTTTLPQYPNIVFHDPPLAFPFMPDSEPDWVRQERMELKSRRNKSTKRYKRRSKSPQRDEKSSAADTSTN